jgi:DNA-binding transcriptional MerR regulator
MQNLMLKKKYYTIGEVAETLDVPAYVIRFWEKSFPSIKPHKARGRRYYKKDDIDKLNLVKKMLYVDKMSIKAAQSILFFSGSQSEKITQKTSSAANISHADFQNSLDNLLFRLNASRSKLIEALDRKVG